MYYVVPTENTLCYLSAEKPNGQYIEVEQLPLPERALKNNEFTRLHCNIDTNEVWVSIEVIVPQVSLEDAKLQKISLSKQLLSDFLENNPLKSSCHGEVVKEYNATFEKQSIFTSKFTSHSVKVQAGVPDVMRWNAVGEECEDWTDAECVAFIIDMDNYVSAVVSHQQHLEIQIKACETVEELNEIEVSYDDFKIA